ncbi:tyrosine-protein phosphatase [Sediminispirochaeta bajacaliforniensis]|uniref:tyrosine-protein phosphatase n=1 Tax=Sediminispirochaeta bajacaliforniensis TaxID=148 RepID=UPI00037EDB5F|nr:tyrosine-protein phosphatase [Sediminispirochaeta bajacaliforniensis]
MKALRRWNLQGVANFRDLGGYPCKNGEATRYGIFFRSTHLHHATEEDLNMLRTAHIDTIIDLRYEEERALSPDRIPEGASYHHISLMGCVEAKDINVNSSVTDTRTLHRMYRQILSFGQEEIAKTLKILANAGRAIYHCAAGKDRTGIISMFLLSIADVPKEDIIADYEVSHSYIRDFTSDISGSNYYNMQLVIEFLEKRYGGAVPYLKAIGIDETTLHTIRSKFILSA